MERAWSRTHDSYLEFYRAEYGRYIVEEHLLGSGAHLIEAHQPAGDWSDAPVPELSIAWLASGPVHSSFDLGAGRFGGVMRRDDAILIAPNAGASIQVDGAHACQALSISYNRLLKMTETTDASLPADGDFGPLHAGLLRSPVVRNLLGQLWHEAKSGAPHGQLFVDGSVLQLAAVLSRLKNTGQPSTALGGLATWQERRATDYLTDRIAEDITIATLAELVGLSTFHFARSFKRSTGLAPYAYLRQLRCTRAKELLATTDRSIGVIAVEVGYETPQAFARMFRAEVGVSPNEYRREHRS